ncbi:MAG: PucR family transcriptional regulator ligand-binding domain-containing protein [Thermaerobacter sp.]|nr:PucR family transcriptional regulator ligand-binding domain-containing protein [Thermaerobacter sp.]
MTFTVADLMDLPIMRGARELTGTGGPRPIRSVSVIEAPVEEFVREGELVLTTGMGCTEPEQLMALVADIARAKASAVGIATGYYVTVIPSTVVELAQSWHLALVDIPWDVRFSEIVEAVSEVLLTERRQLLDQAKEMQSEVWRVILRHGSASDVMAALAARVGAPLWVTAPDGVLLAGDPTAAPGEALTVPVRSTTRLEGYLQVVATSPGSVDPDLASEAASALATWFLYQEAERQRRFQSRDALLWSLAYGEVDLSDVADRAQILGYHPTRPYLGLLGRVDHGDPTEGAEAGVLSTVHELVAKSLARYSPAPLAARRGDSFLVYLEIRPGDPVQVARRFLDDLDRRLRDLSPRVVMSWGIGLADQPGNRFHHAYRQAHEALNIGYGLAGPGHRTYFSDVRIYQMLLHLAQEPVAQELLAATLSPLDAYDNKRHGELVPTLDAFIRTRGQISETARLLNLHRQSLTYRLSQIERLTGRTLDDPETWFLFSFALHIRKLQTATLHLHPEA